MRLSIHRDGIGHDLIEIRDADDGGIELWTRNGRSPWRMLLCKMGFHRFRYWLMAPSFRAMFPDHEDIQRSCIHCEWMEKSRDGLHWRGRV